MEVRVNANKTFKAQNANISGLSAVLIVEADAVGTPLLTAFNDFILNPKRVIIDIDLKQNGKQYKIASGQLAPIHLESNWDNYSSFYASRDGWVNSNRLVFEPETATTTAKYWIPFFIDFGTVINLDRDDTLEARLQFPSTALAPSVSPTNTYFQLEWKQGIGVQTIIPKIILRSLSTDDGTVDMTLGDNITSIFFANLEGGSDNIAGIERTSRFFTSYQVQSDRFDDRRTVETLYAEAYKDMPAESSLDQLHPSIPIFQSSTEIDNTTLRLQMDTTLLNPDMNFIVYRQFEICPGVTAKADKMIRKHGSINYRKAIGH